jgi:hypothetical protein
MPSSSDALSVLKVRNALADSDDVSNCLMPRHARKHIPQVALLHEMVGVTDATGEDLYQKIAWTGLLEFNFPESQLGTFVLEERGLVGCRKRHGHGVFL